MRTFRGVVALVAMFVSTPAAIAAHDPSTPFAVHGEGRLHRYTVVVEAGIGLDLDATRHEIDRILGDHRSWIGVRDVAFQQVAPGESWDFRILIASPAKVDAVCAPLRTGGYLSCRNGRTVALNADRWNHGVEDYGASLLTYRRYLVNHEVGHMIGEDHTRCPRRGATAPIMMQQSKGLDGCTANGWVDPGRRRSRNLYR